jgi:hypothetical protein
MTISKHIHILRQHLAQLGLESLPVVQSGDQPEVFKVCFLNKYEMQQWKKLRHQEASALSTTNQPDLKHTHKRD